MFFTSPNNYTFTTGGFDITLNALGTDSVGRNYTQCYTVSGAKLYVYINDDDADIHIYRRVLTDEAEGAPDTLLSNVYARDYDILCYPTHFTSQNQVYVYAAIPRSETADQVAVIVYPTQEIDIFGQIDTTTDPENPTTQQVGDPDYYYINLGGIISAAYTGPRRWVKNIVQGAINGYIVGDDAAFTRGNSHLTEEDLKREILKLREYIDSNLFFERYPVGDPFEVMVQDPVTGEMVPKQEQVKDQDGNPLFYTDAEQTSTTSVPTEWPVLQTVINENTAIRLKTKFLGLFSETWISAYGLNADGTGNPGGGGGFVGDRLDDWKKYDISKPQVLGANLGVDLHDRVIKLENKKYITSWNDLTDKPSLGKFAYKDLLTEDDIPQLSINKIINLQQSLDKKLDKSIFDELFEKVTLADGKTTAIKAKYGLFSVGFVSAYGQNDDESSSSGSIIKDRLDDWKIYTDDKAQWVLSAKLGVELYTALNTTVATSLADLDERIKALAADPGEILSFPSKGSGNAVTSVVKSGTTVTVTKGATFQESISDLATIRSNAANGNTAYGWGNHASAGYQKSISDLATIRSNAANGNTAYGWGNHASAGYIKGNQTITLSGDVTGSGTTAITTSIGAGKVTNAMLAGSIEITKLKSYSMNLWGNTVSLGGTTNGPITIKNGSKSVTLSVDSNGYLSVNAGFYSTSFISAYGLSSSSAITSSGGHITSGHLYLDGAVSNSSTSNVTQIIFRANGDQQVALSSNKNELIINPNSSGTNGQIELGVNGGNTRFRSDTAKFAVRGYLRVGTEDVGSGWDSWRMYVNGTACIESTLNCRDSIQLKGQTIHSSDVRLKNIGDDVLLSIKDIADAPCFKFSFKDEEDSKTFRIGSSAQYWQNILPDTVSVDDQGWLGLDYTAVSYAAVVALAKQSESHEERIKRLEEENKELRNKIVELERA